MPPTDSPRPSPPRPSVYACNGDDDKDGHLSPSCSQRQRASGRGRLSPASIASPRLLRRPGRPDRSSGQSDMRWTTVDSAVAAGPRVSILGAELGPGGRQVDASPFPTLRILGGLQSKGPSGRPPNSDCGGTFRAFYTGTGHGHCRYIGEPVNQSRSPPRRAPLSLAAHPGVRSSRDRGVSPVRTLDRRGWATENTSRTRPGLRGRVSGRDGAPRTTWPR